MSKHVAELFKRLTAGVYVVGVAAGNQRNAFTAAWVMQVSFDPLLVALSINPRHSSHALLKQGGGFSINVLRADQQDLARHFGAPATTDKLAAVRWRAGRTGAPLLGDALAWLDCELHGECPAGDHVLVLGRVVDGALLEPEAPLLLYRDTGHLNDTTAWYPDFSPAGRGEAKGLP
jgi:flavin reductase (DIM6/NTAB) family NADH-FMN oxidoreductase RutF